MIQTKSEQWLFLVLAAWTFSFAAFAEGEEGARKEPDVTVEVTEGVNFSVTDETKPETIAEKMVDAAERLESLTGAPAKSWVQRKFDATKAKFNFVNRMRIGRRDVNKSDGKISSIPVGMIMFNGTAALIGIHIAESVAIGPAFIAFANSGALPETLSTGLLWWGRLLINPVPLGPLIDWSTETFCWMTLVVVKTDIYHKGVYWIEMKMVKIGGALAKVVGLDHVWNALFEQRSGVEQLALAYEKNKGSFEYNAKDLSFYLKNAKGQDLARLKVSFVRKNWDLRLEEFELFAAAATPEGRSELAQKLKVFGSDIRDAVLQPGMMVQGKHGTQMDVENSQRQIWKTEGTSVLLRSTTVPTEFCSKVLAGAA